MIGGVNRLTRLQDRNGNAIVITRDRTTGAVTTVTSPNGRVLSFTSVTGSRGTPLVSRVSDPLKREVCVPIRQLRTGSSSSRMRGEACGNTAGMAEVALLPLPIR